VPLADSLTGVFPLKSLDGPGEPLNPRLGNGPDGAEDARCGVKGCPIAEYYLWILPIAGSRPAVRLSPKLGVNHRRIRVTLPHDGGWRLHPARWKNSLVVFGDITVPRHYGTSRNTPSVSVLEGSHERKILVYHWSSLTASLSTHSPAVSVSR
jgi:hypothetical protein